MSEKITIPKSLKYSFENFELLELLDKQNAPPPTFIYLEVQNFNDGKNLINLCKADLYQFILNIFNQIWQLDIYKSFEPVNAKEIEDTWLNAQELLSPQVTWDEKSCYWLFKQTKNKQAKNKQAKNEQTKIALCCKVEAIEKSNNYRIQPFFCIFHNNDWFTESEYDVLNSNENWKIDENKNMSYVGSSLNSESTECRFSLDDEYINAESFKKLQKETQKILEAIEAFIK